MRKELIYISTVGMTQQQWLKERDRGIGASETGTVLGLNPYKASVTLFYEKIGMLQPNQVENMAMFMGKYTEEWIADLWQYWENDQETMMQNYRTGKVLRKCSRVNAYIINPKYPWLFVSLDRLIHKNGTGKQGALECKNMSYHASRIWESSIPPAYVTQVQQQMGVCELSFAEMAVLQDGRNFMDYPFDYSKGIFSTIVERTKDFWDRVEKGRKCFGKIIHGRATFNMRMVEEVQAELDELEPLPDGSDAYRDYQNKKYTDSKAGEVIGTPEYLAKAIEHLKIKEKMKKLGNSSKLIEQQLIAGIGPMQKMTFGDNGYVSFKKDINGSNRFNNAVKKK